MSTVKRYAAAAEFLAVAEPNLMAAEVENNLILGIAHGLARDPSSAPDAYFAVVHNPQPAMCAFSSLPDKIGITRCSDEGSIELLARDAAAACPRVTHLVGPEPTIASFATHFAAQRGWPVRRAMAQRIHVITELPLADQASGNFRPARLDDIAIVTQWIAAFIAEVGETESDPARVARERVTTGQLFVWDHGGPVSMAGVTGKTPRGARIALVYTPPNQRGHGFATNCVSQLTRHLLQSGNQYCCLYTDLANPTSNAIYHRIGYRPVSDSAAYVVGDSPVL